MTHGCPDQTNEEIVSRGTEPFDAPDAKEAFSLAKSLLDSGEHKEKNGKFAKTLECPYDAIGKAVSSLGL